VWHFDTNYFSVFFVPMVRFLLRIRPFGNKFIFYVNGNLERLISTGLNGALENNEKNGGKGNDSPKESYLDGKSTNFKNRDQNNDQRVLVCPILIRPIAREIVSAGKSLQLLCHVQREHVELSERVDAYRKSSLGNYENVSPLQSGCFVPSIS
jgi:hypothetical protein